MARNYADIVRPTPAYRRTAREHWAALAPTFYGSTSVENLWLIDGVNTTNVIYGIQGKVVNNEFIQEVDVKASGFSAEYGGALGGIVNVVTHSGGNEFHGGAFAYFDGAGWRASQVVSENESLNGMTFDPEWRWDAGVSLGGFFNKDRLWFFGAYEYVSAPSTTSRNYSNPLVPSSAGVSHRPGRQSLFGQADLEHRQQHDAGWKRAFSDPSQLEGAVLELRSRIRTRAPGSGSSSGRSRLRAAREPRVRIHGLRESSGLPAPGSFRARAHRCGRFAGSVCRRDL